MKFIFFFLATLNLGDAFLTYFGINTGNITEENPIMSTVYEINPILFLSIKLILSLCLISLVFLMRFPVGKTTRSLCYIATFFYIFVFILHGYWITRIFY